MESNPYLNDNRRVPIVAIRSSPAKIVKKRASKAFNPSIPKNDELQDLALDVEFKSDPTDLQKLTAKQSTNKTEPEHNVELPSVSKRLPIKKPRVPRKPRAKLAAPVDSNGSVEAANDSDKRGIEKVDRFSSLNTEPTVPLNAEQMDDMDAERILNSDLNRFEQFNRNSKTRVESDEFIPANIAVAGNKEYARGSERVISKPTPSVFDRDFLNVMNSPYSSISLNAHPQISKRSGFYIQ
jgi:hypothetical protein